MCLMQVIAISRRLIGAQITFQKDSCSVRRARGVDQRGGGAAPPAQLALSAFRTPRMPSGPLLSRRGLSAMPNRTARHGCAMRGISGLGLRLFEHRGEVTMDVLLERQKRASSTLAVMSTHNRRGWPCVCTRCPTRRYPTSCCCTPASSPRTLRLPTTWGADVRSAVCGPGVSIGS